MQDKQSSRVQKRLSEENEDPACTVLHRILICRVMQRSCLFSFVARPDFSPPALFAHHYSAGEPWEMVIYNHLSRCSPADRFPTDFTAGTHARLAFFLRNAEPVLWPDRRWWWNSPRLGPLRGNLRVELGSISPDETGSMSEKRPRLCRRSRWNEVKRSLTDVFAADGCTGDLDWL